MLIVNRVVKRRGDREVLKGVSLRLERSGVGVLIGPSGSGKSTVLRCINGLEPFDDGDLAVGSVRLSAGAFKERQERLGELRRRVGMVFQQFNLFAHLTALQNVIEAPVHVLRKPRELAIEQARTFLDRVGMADRLDALPHQLSGGQQQRVAIARALAMQPELILFDEPTSALDPKMTAEVQAVIADLAKSDQTMLIVTHAMAFARKVATEVHVLADGVIVESGKPQQVFDTPAHAATRELLNDSFS